MNFFKSFYSDSQVRYGQNVKNSHFLLTYTEDFDEKINNNLLFPPKN